MNINDAALTPEETKVVRLKYMHAIHPGCDTGPWAKTIEVLSENNGDDRIAKAQLCKALWWARHQIHGLEGNIFGSNLIAAGIEPWPQESAA